MGVGQWISALKEPATRKQPSSLSSTSDQGYRLGNTEWRMKIAPTTPFTAAADRLHAGHGPGRETCKQVGACLISSATFFSSPA